MTRALITAALIAVMALAGSPANAAVPYAVDEVTVQAVSVSDGTILPLNITWED